MAGGYEWLVLAVTDATTRTVAIVGGVATVIAAVAGVVGGLLAGIKTAKATRYSADRQKESSIDTAREERFAAWQNQKRETYATFLVLARPAARDGTPNDPYVAQGEAVMLVAFPELQTLIRSLLADPRPLANPEKWTELLAEMTADVNLSPAEAEEKRRRQVAAAGVEARQAHQAE